MLRHSTVTTARSVLRRQAIKQARNGRILRVERGPGVQPTPRTSTRLFASAAAKATVGSTPTADAAPVLRDVFPDAAPKLEGDDPNSRYESSVRNGVLRDDDHQREVVGLLQGLHDQLKDYTPEEVPPSHGSSGWVSRLTFRIFPNSPRPALIPQPIPWFT